MNSRLRWIFSAGDTANGSLAARGSLGLGAAAPSTELTATLKHLRIATRDDTVVTASGNVAIPGTVTSPKVAELLATARAILTGVVAGQAEALEQSA